MLNFYAHKRVKSSLFATATILIVAAISLLNILIPTKDAFAEGQRIINFKDENLCISVVDYLQIHDYATCLQDAPSITADSDEIANLSNVATVWLGDRGISNLTGIEEVFTGVQELWLNNNQLSDESDLNVLSNLTSLRTLYLSSNQISTVPDLSALIDLQTLYLGNNTVSNIDNLSHLANLQELYLQRNRISDISALSGLVKLQALGLNNNQISDISPIVSKNFNNTNELLRNQQSTVEIDGLSYSLPSLYLAANRQLEGDLASWAQVNPWARLDTNNATLSPDGRSVTIDNIFQPATVTIRSWNAAEGSTLTINSTYNGDYQINFADSNLCSAIALSLSGTYSLTDNCEEESPSITMNTDSIRDVTSLSLNNQDISDLSGIDTFLNLSSLNLASNNITNIGPLQNLSALTDLDLSYNHIVDISAISSRDFDTINLGHQSSIVYADEGWDWEDDSRYLYYNLPSNSIYALAQSAPDDAPSWVKNLGELSAENANLFEDYARVVDTDNLAYLRISSDGEGSASGSTLTIAKRVSLYFNDYNFCNAVAEAIGNVGGNFYNYCTDAAPQITTDNITAATVTSITASDLGISDLYADGIQNFTNLQNLDLSHNQISDISQLSYYPVVQVLDLGYNQISDISPISGQDFGTVYLNNQSITAQALDGQYSLPTLYVAANTGLSEVANWVSGLSGELTPINARLDGNDVIMSTATEQATVSISGGNAHDSVITLNYDKTDTIEFADAGLCNAVVESLNNLGKVFTNGCENTTPSIIMAISDIGDVTQVYASYREIKDVSGIENFTNLQNLDLSYNQISTIPDLSVLTKLQTLGLSYNQLPDNPDLSAISTLTSLQSLNLDGDHISIIPDLSALTNLRSLSLSNNQISTIPDLSSLTNLRTLNLHNNQISDVSSLAEITSLGNIYLSGNHIYDISPIMNVDYRYCWDGDYDCESGQVNLRNQSATVNLEYDDSNQYDLPTLFLAANNKLSDVPYWVRNLRIQGDVEWGSGLQTDNAVLNDGGTSITITDISQPATVRVYDAWGDSEANNSTLTINYVQGPTITFEDSAFCSAVVSSITKSYNNYAVVDKCSADTPSIVMREDDIANVTELNINNLNITSLSGIESFTGLTRVNLSGTASTNDTQYSIPPLYLAAVEALDGTLEADNATINADNGSITITNPAEPATITINGGKADGSTLTITYTGSEDEGGDDEGGDSEGGEEGKDDESDEDDIEVPNTGTTTGDDNSTSSILPYALLAGALAAVVAYYYVTKHVSKSSKN